MKVRSVTGFLDVSRPGLQGSAIHIAGQLVREVVAVLEVAGFSVQTTRLATQPLSLLPGNPQQLAPELWSCCSEVGFDYVSLGPVLADRPDADLSLIAIIPELISSSEGIFAGVLVAHPDRGLHLEAVQRTAQIVHEIAHSTDLGFGNLRLAMLANVGPHAPFFPAAYHDGGPPAVALATQSADLAVAAFSEAGTLSEAQDRLVTAVEAAGAQMASLVEPVAERYGYRFAGIDFSLAPFPDELCSIGAAVERLGVDRFGAAGTLFVAALLTRCLEQARYPRCGFNGLMLPVLEDATLASRSQQGLFTVNDLLLYSAVCGTGLDTVPLPGDVSREELAGILLDVATLALSLDKPLTARLMPIPGAEAGEMTRFDFPYFANGRVLDTKGWGSQRLFERGGWLAM